jgi:hypothetical protein
MHGAAARAIGLTMSRPSAAQSVEVFRRELISGIQAELCARADGLALQYVTGIDEEITVYSRRGEQLDAIGQFGCHRHIGAARTGSRPGRERTARQRRRLVHGSHLARPVGSHPSASFRPMICGKNREDVQRIQGVGASISCRRGVSAVCRRAQPAR